MTRLYQWAERQQVLTILEYRETHSQTVFFFHLVLTWICSCVEAYNKLSPTQPLLQQAVFFLADIVSESKKLPLLSKHLKSLSPVEMNSFIVYLRGCVAKHYPLKNS